MFTPKGDLYKLPLGATVLDFAFNIHSGLGCKCIGGKVNGKSRKINHKLASGDTVEVLTAVNQTPKMDWLQFLVTSKARTKVRQAVNEMANRSAELAKELLQRRFKNRKIEVEEAALMRVIKKLGFKTVTEFYNAISSEQLDVNDVINQYEMMDRKVEDDKEKRSAEEFQLQTPDDENSSGSDSDVLVIGDNVKGMNYRLAKCCNPICGDVWLCVGRGYYQDSPQKLSECCKYLCPLSVSHNIHTLEWKTWATVRHHAKGGGQ